MEPLIAIVDDDKAVRDALQRMLRSHGFASTVFASGEDYISAAGPDFTSCLIADVRMPGMSGLELQDYLRTHGFLLPTVLITAQPTSREQRQAIAGGAVSYLAKPLSEQILLDTVREALENGVPVGDANSSRQDLPRT